MGGTHSSRKYVDLILDASSKWANFDPPNEIKVGDYGTVNRQTARFEKEGNIYEEGSKFKMKPSHEPQSNPAEEIFEAVSKRGKRRDLTLGPEISLVGLAEAVFKGQWQFDAKRGALLIMVRPRITRMPDAALQYLISHPDLKEKRLVTEVLSCPAYSMYLSSGNNDIVSMALIGKIPLSSSPISGEISASWWTQNASGLFRTACDQAGKYAYTPLYVLKEITKPRILFRDSPEPEPITEDLWVNSHKPWDPLTEDGEEDLIEDTIFD